MSGTKVIVNGEELKYKSQYDLDINVVGGLDNTKFILELDLGNTEIKVEFDKETVQKIKERCEGFLEGKYDN